MKWLNDIFWGARLLRRNTHFAVVVVLTLSASMAASTTMFTIIETFLFSSLPFERADELVMIWSNSVDQERKKAGENLPLTPGAFTDLQRSPPALTTAVGLISDDVNVSIGGEAQRAHCMYTVGDVFSLLGVRAALGRTLRPEDERPDAADVVLVSHEYWRQELGGSPDVIGRTIHVYENPHEIVGVLPAEFRFTRSLVAADPRLSEPVDLWTPMDLNGRSTERRFRYVLALGRLAGGADLGEARERIESYARHAAGTYPETDQGYGFSIVPLGEQVFGHLRPVLLLLWLATSLVLLVACANLATLLAARGESRRQEVALCVALGAGRGRIVRQSLGESLLLALIGGLLSLPLAALALRWIGHLRPLPVFESYPPRLGLVVVAVALGVALLAGLLFGALPAWRAGRVDAARSLQQNGARLAGAGPKISLSLLVIVQIALTTALLCGVGLAGRSLAATLEADLGVEVDRILTFDLHLPMRHYREPARKIDFLDRLLEGVGALPGVESVGMNYALPLGGTDPSNRLRVPGQTSDEPGEVHSANLGLVNAGYFETLGIPLLRGRLFRESDTREATPVAVIDQGLADRYFPGEDPLGRRLAIAGDQELTIVGVVGNVRHHLSQTAHRPYVYLPYPQRSYLFTSLAVKTTLRDPLDVTEQIRGVARELDPRVPLSNPSTLQSAFREAIAPQLFSFLLIATFAGLALILTLVGTFGVSSFVSRQRRREAAVRMALGSPPRRVFFLLVRKGALLGLAGALAGIALAQAARGLTASLSHELASQEAAAHDLWLYLSVAAIMILASTAACYFPARSLSRVDPATNLR